MAALAKQTLSAGDIKELPKAHVESVAHETFKVSKLTVQPGWKWSECIKPLVGTDSCQVAHSGVVTEGSMTVKMDDGTEMTFNAVRSPPSLKLSFSILTTTRSPSLSTQGLPTSLACTCFR